MNPRSFSNGELRDGRTLLIKLRDAAEMLVRSPVADDRFSLTLQVAVDGKCGLRPQ
jgi:hypothetical protein